MNRWLCKKCGWRLMDGELLRAAHPFDAGEEIVGCPECRAIDRVALTCSEPGCWNVAEYGWLSAAGYRWTCYEHATGLHKGHST